MELRQLTYFLTAAQTQNFRQAAERCLVAQPSLSRQIAALEEELGVTLFRRHKKRVSLTDAGQEFALYVRNAFDQLQQGQQALDKLREGQAGTIRLGCVEPLAAAFLPGLLPSFHASHPKIHVQVRVSRTDELLSLLTRGDLDLGLIFDPDAKPDVLVVQELFRQPLRLLISAKHPLASLSPALLTLERIAEQQLYTLGETSRLRRVIDRSFRQRGLDCRPTIEIDSVEGLKELVKLGDGVTLILPALLHPGQPEDQVMLLPVHDLSDEFIFALVHRRTGTIPPAARRFINYVQDRTERGG